MILLSKKVQRLPDTYTLTSDSKLSATDSAVYKGYVWHRRYLPRAHQFRYRVFMMYLNLQQIDDVLNRTRLWGSRWYHPGRLKRDDYFSIDGNNAQSIDAAVRQEIKMQLQLDLTGAICLLTNFRYFGHIINPISCYYCFDDSNSRLIALLIEVTNTPWGEKHHYVLDLREGESDTPVEFEKKMHVSPFMPMNRTYRWRGSSPSQSLRYSLALLIKSEEAQNTDDTIHFDSGVVFKRLPATGANLNRVLYLYPLMTIKVVLAIYWQALKIWIKRIPFVPHPNKTVV